jgi:hypothetical protein
VIARRENASMQEWALRQGYAWHEEGAEWPVEAEAEG